MSEFSTLNGYKVKDKKAIRYYNTIADMKADTTLKEGMQIKTSGYYNIFDGGQAEYKIIDDNTLQEDNGSLHLLNNGLFAKLINIESLNPQIFGAYGYKGSYDSTKEDSTNALKNTINFAQNNNIKNIDLLGLNYNCSGDNVLGLEKTEVNSQLQLNIKGNGAVFYWDSENNENNNFAFVGYLRYSTWENFHVRCLNQNYKGNIFTTHFDIENQQHYFSCNTFKSIFINQWWQDGTCNKVFDFSIDGIMAHDDLSIFEEINAFYYNIYFYTNNNEAVSNEFRNSYTVSMKQNTIDFFIDCSQWSGHLTINNHQFILTQENCILVKTSQANNESHLPIKILNCRLEARVSKFKYCDLKSYDLYIDNLRPLSSFNMDNTHTYFDITAQNNLIITNTRALPPYIKITTSQNKRQGNLIIENCSFYNNNLLTPMPILSFDNFNSINEMLSDNTFRYFNDISIKNGLSSSKSEWFKNYHMSSQGFTHYNGLQKILNEQYRSTNIPDGNIVLDEIKVYNKTAYKCSITIADYDGQNTAFRQNILFSNGIANITETIKCVLPQNKVRSMTISLQDENGTALDNQSCVVDIGYRPIIFDDEISQTTNKWINK